jgi:curved DNA-binding protein CbpA
MNDDDNLDPYAVLGVPSTASPADVTRAYRAKLRTLHPDTRRLGLTTVAVVDTQLQQVLAAYRLLRDPERRAGHDRTVEHQRQVRIPVTHYHGESIQTSASEYSLRAGPVRRHR